MRVRSLLLSCCVVCAVIACQTSKRASSGPQPAPSGAAAAPQAAVPAQPAPDKPLELGLRVEALTRKGQGFIESDEPLRSGDRMALHITVSEPAYVYVGYASSGQVGTLLYPKSNPEQVVPGATFRYPPAGQWLALDKKLGEENVFVYAAKRPLTIAETTALLREDSAKAHSVKKLAQKKKAEKRRTSQAPDDSPEAITASTRGLQLVDEEGPATQTEDGVTKVRFRIRHQR